MKALLEKDLQGTVPEILSVIPTMDVVVFPHMLVPLLVVDEKIIQGINRALQGSKLVLLVAAKKQIDGFSSIGTGDLYSIGTVASIMRLIKLPEGGIKVLVQGLSKARIVDFVTHDDGLVASVKTIEFAVTENDDELVAQIRNLKMLAEKMAIAGQSFSPDFHLILTKMQDPLKIADFILSHLNLNVEDAQKLLETFTIHDFLGGIYQHLSKEIEVAKIQEKIKNDARDAMNRAQKEFYLREQLRAIKNELGDEDGQEIEEMRQKLEALDIDQERKNEIKRQINRLERIVPDSMEAAVVRSHLEWIFAMPWNTHTQDNLSIEHAKEVLNQDHYGLIDIKERILDFISVCNLRKEGFAPILCLVGPPGTGKTSLGQSIAKSLGREYVRISLGGVKDEAEIRGHRRTYVGALPGRFIQALRKAGSSNPVVIIDELDKIGSDFRGDPSAAMLEVLDPHQNKTFYDNYLGIPFDLSKVMFVATANSLEPISEPLRDRMEIIEVSGYTLEEKVKIARHHLLGKIIKDTGLDGHPVSFGDDLLTHIIMNYTRESGVRQLDRILRSLCSKMARSLVERKKLPRMRIRSIEQHIGPRKFSDEEESHIDQVGITNGLAWTSFGGQMLKIEAMLMPGKGKLILTGQLGNVMKESAQAAWSYARAHAKEFGIEDKQFTHFDLHIHVPAGAVPKDGPSAGITILASILSVYTKRPINNTYAMTGELNLRGDVMPIGGVKEKILAAKRNGVKHVIMPSKNKCDLVGKEEVAKGINVIWVDHADEVLDHVLMDKAALRIA